MKKIGILLLLIIVSCTSTQSFHTEMYKGQEILVGKTPRTALEKSHYKTWFAENYKDYTPDAKQLAQLKPVINNYAFTIVMGTWCGDSREQVPALYKVLDEAGYKAHPDLYCVPRKYKDYEPTKKYDLIRVPTIIVYKNGKKIGRIIEYPMQSIEADLLQIINGNYRHELENE